MDAPGTRKRRNSLIYGRFWTLLDTRGNRHERTENQLSAVRFCPGPPVQFLLFQRVGASRSDRRVGEKCVCIAHVWPNSGNVFRQQRSADQTGTRSELLPSKQRVGGSIPSRGARELPTEPSACAGDVGEQSSQTARFDYQLTTARRRPRQPDVQRRLPIVVFVSRTWVARWPSAGCWRQLGARSIGRREGNTR